MDSLVSTVASGTTAETAIVGSEGYVAIEVMLGSVVVPSDALARPEEASVVALDRLQSLTDQSASLGGWLLAHARTFLTKVNQFAAGDVGCRTQQRICCRLPLAGDRSGHAAATCRELHQNRLIDHSRGKISITNKRKCVAAPA